MTCGRDVHAGNMSGREVMTRRIGHPSSDFDQDVEKIEGRGIGPMNILEHGKDRHLAAQIIEHANDRGGRHFLLPLGGKIGRQVVGIVEN